ncbi:FxDxF family PEP-CTERM protein [Massilia sp. TSP1-1-2]|uniref:FxDxF family PEP-CTERM protein n=1 Tax=unclassified Massilia TaxID=2609279 RepID=UPI003CF61A31
MKNSTSLIAALVLATASLGTPAAHADDISNGPQALAVLDNSAYFGDSFAANNNGDTFMDHFVFNVSGVPLNLDAIVSSVSRTAATGLDITAFGLFSSAGSLISAGSGSSGAQDVWTVSANNLAEGSYYLMVSGTMLSDTSGSFGGAVMLNPVPEPATYGMLLAGLGVVGLLGRRRKAANEQ